MLRQGRAPSARTCQCEAGNGLARAFWQAEAGRGRPQFASNKCTALRVELRRVQQTVGEESDLRLQQAGTFQSLSLLVVAAAAMGFNGGKDFQRQAMLRSKLQRVEQREAGYRA